MIEKLPTKAHDYGEQAIAVAIVTKLNELVEAVNEMQKVIDLMDRININIGKINPDLLKE